MRVVLTWALAGYAFAVEPIALHPDTMRRLGTVDERFQSFNVEMVEVTGGRFWAPYRDEGKAPEKPSGSQLAVPGIDQSLFRTRQPIDLANVRLRKLAAGLSRRRSPRPSSRSSASSPART